MCEVVTLELLQEVAAEVGQKKEGAKSQAASPSGERLDVGAWLRDRGQAFRVKNKTDREGRTVYVLAVCPFNEAHTDPDACIMQEPNGRLSAKCFHNGCRGNGWRAFREKIGPPEPHHWDPPRKGAATPPSAPAPQPGSSPLPLLLYRDVKPSLNAADFVERLLLDEAMSVIYGESGCGKTFLALDLALHVAAGCPWFGRAVEKGAVLYLALEGQHGIVNRIAAFKKLNHDCEDLPLAVVPVAVNLLDPTADTSRVIAAAKAAAGTLRLPVRLVVVDTLSRALAGGNENSSEDMGALVRNGDRIRQTVKAHVQYVHHSGKVQALGARGHSLLRAATDTEIEVSRDEERGESVARVTKQRELELEGEFGFRLDRVTLGQDRRGKAVTSCVVVPLERSPLDPPSDVRGRRAAATVRKNGTKILEAIDTIKSRNLVATKTRIKGESGVCGEALDTALGKLEVDGHIEAYEAEAQAGKHGRQKTTAFRRKS